MTRLVKKKVMRSIYIFFDQDAWFSGSYRMVGTCAKTAFRGPNLHGFQRKTEQASPRKYFGGEDCIKHPNVGDRNDVSGNEAFQV